MCFSFANENIIASGDLSGDVYWSLDDEGTLTINGNGGMYWTGSIDGGGGGSGSGDYGSAVPEPNVKYPESFDDSRRPWLEYTDKIKSVIVESGITSIANDAFSGCIKLESVSLPDTLETINGEVFWGCSSLGAIVLPDSLQYIGNKVFTNCSSLISITIPATVTSIGNSAFEYCESLEEIFVDDNNTEYKSIDGVLLSSDGTKLICCPMALNTAHYSMPNTVTKVMSRAFAYNKTIESVSFSSDLGEIEYEAFYDCASLKTAWMPDSVTSIGSNAFQCCSSLQSVRIPSGVNRIGSQAFYGCTDLTDVIICEGVSRIDDAAFAYTGIKSFFIPSSVSELRSKPYRVFYGCDKLTKINVAADNPKYVSLDGVLYNKQDSSLSCFPHGLTGHYSVSAGTNSIMEGAFSGTSINGISIPDTVAQIDKGAFNNCTLLQEGYVYYEGSESGWNSINIGTRNNDSLFNAIRIYDEGSIIECQGFISQINTGSYAPLIIVGGYDDNGQCIQSTTLDVISDNTTAVTIPWIDQCDSIKVFIIDKASGIPLIMDVMVPILAKTA